MPDVERERAKNNNKGGREGRGLNVECDVIIVAISCLRLKLDNKMGERGQGRREKRGGGGGGGAR